MTRVLFVFFLAIVTVVLSKIVETQNCANVPDDKCKVGEVQIEPCPGKRGCRLKKEKDAFISFSFTPEYTATRLKTEVYGVINGMDARWVDLESDACKFTACPTEAGKPQVFNFTLSVKKIYPTGTFPIKWFVIDSDDQTNKCCFQTTIRLEK